MPTQSPGQTVWAAPLPLTALNIGLWDEDVEAGSLRCDPIMGHIFGLSDDEVADGISWRRLSALFHPDDLTRGAQQRQRVREAGGLFVWEHRIVPAPGVVRWVLARGRFDRGADGRMRGRGIVIDVTDTRTDNHIDSQTHFLTERVAVGPTVDRMAGHALELWELMLELEPAHGARFRPALEALLYELGRAIAASLTGQSVRGDRGNSLDPKVH